jgi:protein-tyrosine kinase
VLVLEANSTRRVAARKAKQALEAANVRVLGTVLNNRTFPIPEKIYRLL